MPLDISNPAELHDPTGFGYSHVARVTGELVLIAGQYDSDAQGHTTTDDFAGQVERAFTNLGVALRSAGLDYGDVAQLRTFIVEHDLEKLTVLGTAIARIWGERPPTQTLLGVAALALPGMLFEVDALAVRA
ncbi:RidA family protein [Nocardia caishijiensis]|uniref:Enamine deaminase RidA (YjgF/YER057c/UK114 family) n=1 Tax=Nocardia caishijiensis TaxID=184756 RepID=A0ABQ6YJQ8_9NOCA|nr:Rid family hydrolase [Nocardia caishijiensis]KAF0846032.1 enamine deaminase RidA (YjgF/YER057c/UK114 family) [Nocardia caishijiensis]